MSCNNSIKPNQSGAFRNTGLVNPFIYLTSSAKGDPDVSDATVDSGESKRSDFSPNLQSSLYGVIYL